MLVGLHDAERDHMPNKSFPNFALMKLSAYHKAKGDAVEWWNPLFNPAYDAVYSSKVFDFTPENWYLPDNTIKGGTGYGDFGELPPEVDSCSADYTIYPDCDYAIGYLTRGCPNKCRWCIVPAKEGQIRAYAKWQDIVRTDTKKLILMDNNILACEHGLNQLLELSQTDCRIDLNQGMDARLVDDGIAEILASVKWIKHVRFSCDQASQIDPIFNAVSLLARHGVKPYRIYVYLLVTRDLDDVAYRVERLKELKGISLYAQAEQNPTMGIVPNAGQHEFARRFIYGRSYKKETWEEYCQRKGFQF